jgi:hypothetical protein
LCPGRINLNSAIYGPSDEIAWKIRPLREAGAGYLLLNGGAPVAANGFGAVCAASRAK